MLKSLHLLKLQVQCCIPLSQQLLHFILIHCLSFTIQSNRGVWLRRFVEHCQWDKTAGGRASVSQAWGRGSGSSPVETDVD